MAEQGDALMLLQALKDEPSFLFLAVQDGKEQPASLLWPQKPDTVVGRRRRAGVHNQAFQPPKDRQILPHQIAGVRCRR